MCSLLFLTLISLLSGSILEGPDINNLKPLVEQAMQMLIDLLKDPSVVVRDTAAWTVGRVCEILPDAVIAEVYLNPLLHALVEGLNAEPRVAANVCWVSYCNRTMVLAIRVSGCHLDTKNLKKKKSQDTIFLCW